MSDLPPGFELESDGLPEGFQLEESPTPLAAAQNPEGQPITDYGSAVVDAALAPTPIPGAPVDDRPLVTNMLTAAGESLKTYPAQFRKGLAAVQMATGGLDPFEIGAAIEQAAQQGRPIAEVMDGRKLLRDTELLGKRGDANREIERVRPRTEPWSPAGITSAIVESAPTTGAGIAAGLAAGPGAGLAVMGGLVGSDRFAERRAAGDSDLAAAGAGLYAAGAEAAGEVIPLGRLLKQIKGLGKPFVRSTAFLEGTALGRIIKQAGLEGSGEVITEALNTLYDQGVLGENATAAEIVDRLAYAGVVGAAMGGGIQGGIEAVRPFVGRESTPPAAGGPAAPPPAGATPAAAPATNSPPPPATNAPPPPPTAAPPPAPAAPAPLDPGGVDLENFGDEPLPADVVRQQFITERGLTQQDDGSFVTADGALLDADSTATLQTFLSEADDAAAALEEQGAPVTPETVRRELQNRQRVRDLQAEREAVRTPEAQAVIDQQIAAAQQPAGGPVAELQTVADKAKERGDAQTAKAAQDAIKNLQEPTDGAVADRGSESGRADLERGEADAGRAGREPAGREGADSSAAAAPAAGPDLAVEGAAGEQAGSLTATASTANAATADAKPAPVPLFEAPLRRGKVGDEMAAGEVVTTVTGRQTTPFPKIDMGSERKAGNTIKRVDEWLMQNALAEAEARGDEFNARSFRQDLKNPPPASKDSAELYLFGDEIPPVIPSVLKPLVTTAKAGNGATAVVIDPSPLRAPKRPKVQTRRVYNSDGSYYDEPVAPTSPAEPKKIEYTTPKGYTTKITITPPRPDRTENAKDRNKWTVQSSTKAGSVTVPTQTSTFDTEAEALEFAERQRAKDMGEAPKTAPEHSAYPTEGASKEDLQGVVAEFNEAQQRQREDGEKITHVFDAPDKGDVVRLQDKVRVQVGDSGWLTVEQARAKVAEWKAHAQAQGDNPETRSANADKVVLSLFDLSGEWSQPWVDAGYQVYRFDIQDDPEGGDVTKFSAERFMDTFSAFEGQDVHAILAACPCTDFAVSGARHFAAKDADGRTVSSVKLVQQTLATIEFFKPAVWAIENPVGRIEALTGLPPWRLSFDPNHFGDPYTKKTLLWGRFDGNLPIAPVEPTEGSKMHRLYGGKSQATKNARSVTPEGFAYAFFMANNAVDNPLLAVAGKYDRLDRDAIKGALDAGLTPAAIDELVEDFYYQELDDEAANKALRDAAKPPPGAPRTDEGSKSEAAEPTAEKPSEKPAAEPQAPDSRFDYGATGRATSDVARELRKIGTVAKQADDDVELGNDKFVPLAKVVEYAREAIAAGIRPVPFQIGTALDIAPFEWQRVLTAAQAPTTLTDQLAGMSDAELEALIDEVAHETAAAETEKPKAVRSAKTKPPKAAPGANQAAPKLRKGRAAVEKAAKPADVDRTAAEIAKSLSVNLSSAGQNALTGLTKLFGTSGKVSAGLTFDEDTYKQAKPYFQALLRDFQAAGKDIRDLIRELLNMLGTGAKPYILRFAQDLRSGNIEASNEQGTVRGEDSAQPDRVAPGSGQAAESERGVRGDGAGESQTGAGATSGADEAGVSGARGRGSRQQRDRESAAGSRRGSGAVGARGAAEAGARVPVDPVAPSATNIPAANFEIGDDLRLGRGGEVEKFDDNIKAIEALKRIEAENRRATADEQKLLARYVGWGGLANAFPDPASGEWKEKWKERGPRLRDLLSKAEYTAARRSTRNAHYTSEPIVRGMWRAARRLGFRGGMALESSMGVGNFVGLKPADLPARFIGIEYDSLTARMAAALYPQATVLHAGFQSVPLPESTFALSIGNPPFGDESLRFQYKPELNRLSIHNQFFVGALDAVRPGGLHIAVVSRFLMDAQDTTARLMLAERAELVAAIRLPDTAFKENARTEVVTDIIILKRRTPEDQEAMKFAIEAFRQGKDKSPDGERERAVLAARVPEWVQTTEIPDPLGGEAMGVNSYFKANPKNIIGVLERSGSMQHGADITVRLDDAASLERHLNEIVDRLPEGVSTIEQDVLDATEERYALLSDALKIAISGEEVGHVKLERDGTMTRVLEREGPDGSLLMTKQVLTAEAPFSDQLAMDEKGRWYRNEVVVDDKGATVKVLGKDGKPTKRNLYQRRVFEKDSEVPLTLRLGKTGFAKLKALAGMRDLLKAQLVMETEDAPAAEMEGNRKKLAKAYEAFVSEFGPINRASTLALAMSMPDGGLISALEVRYQPARSKAQAERSGLPEQEELAKPAPILRERVVPKYEPPTAAATAADALAIVLAERGAVDIDRIAELRSMTAEAAIDELQQGGKPLVYLDPETQQWETRDAYLSGQVRRKLQAARNAGLEKNIAALEAIQPEPWGAENVTVKMGATWVPPAVYAQFVEHLLGGNARVSFSVATNSFDAVVNDPDRAKRGEWGTDRASPEYIINRVLNSMTPAVYDTDSEGNQRLNQDETQLAQVKAREIVNAFDEWIFNDTDRRNSLVDLFNEKYNTRVSRQFDGSHLTLPGKVPDSIISMRRHQKNAIWRGISTKALLLDHVVGAGKTFTGIARAMERRRMGISRKPAIVVPNHLVEQWAADIYRLYPAAKVLAAGKKDFEAKNRRKLFGKIATGDWDIVVIPHSSFGFIGISPDTELRYLEQELATAIAAVEEAWEAARESGQDGGRTKPFNVKQAERLAEKLQTRMDKLREGTRDRLLTYEQLGIDDLTIDEAHEFKNLFYSSRLTNVRGMGNPSGSRKAADLYNKVRATREMGGAITFMTGTPVSNSAVELYTMMRYLAPEALEELGITHFDAWRAQYVDASLAFEPTETGRLKQVTRMGRQWENMRSLMDLYYSFADAVTIDDIKAAFAEDNPGREFPVPKLKGGDRKLVKIEPTEAQLGVLNEIIAGFDGLDSIQDPRERNATRLRLMDRARKVSLDVRAVNPGSTSAEKGGKLETVAKEVKRIYDASTERRGTQLIFLDRSVPKSKGDDAVVQKYDELIARQERALQDGDEALLLLTNEELEKFDSAEIAELRSAQNGGWNAYQQIKDNLVALGIPAGEIRFIQEANTDEQKEALFDAVRGGKVRVLLGSTPRMGAGTNVQDRLVAEHHVDVTWKPSDIEQREGRIIRQGNLFVMTDVDGKPNPLYDPLFEVEIMAYATLRTVDSKMWSLNATKLKTINGLRKYDGSFSMQIDDEESVSMAEMAAEASGNPLLLERVQLETEINDLELQQRAHRRKVMAQQDAIDYAKRIVLEYPERIQREAAKAAEAEKRVAAVLGRIKTLTVDVEGKTYTRLPDAQKAAFDAIQEQQAGDERAKYAVAVNGKRYTNKQDIADALGEALGDAEPFEMTVGDKTYYQRTGAARAIRERVLQAAEQMGGEKDVSVPLGSAFGFDLVADVQKLKVGGGFTVGLALTDRGKTVAAAYGPDFKLGDKGALSIQALRPAVSGMFEIYSKIANDSSASVMQGTLDSARARLPELEAKPVPTFAKADELSGKIARLKEVIAELSTTSEPAKTQPSFSRGASAGLKPATAAVVARVESMVAQITKAWANPPRAVVVSSMQDPKVPEAVRKADADQKAGGATGEPLGWIINGTIYINAAAANTADKVIRTVNHEALGHFGLRGAFGNQLAEELKKVALLRAKDVKAKLAEYGMADTSANRLRAAEEVLARMAEENPQLPLVQRVLAAIRSFLRPIFKALGVSLELTDAEIIRDYLTPARDYVRRGAKWQLAAGVPAFSRQRNPQIDTPEFKAWFGDWRAVSVQKRLDAMPLTKITVPDEWRGKSVVEMRSMMAAELDRMVKQQVEIEHPELGGIQVGRRGASKTKSTSGDPAKMLVAVDIERVLGKAIVAGFMASNEQGVDVYTKLLLPVEVDGTALVAIFTVRHQTDGQWYYNTVTVAENEKRPGSYGSPGAPARPLGQTPITGLDEFVRRPLDRVNPATVSKVVGANGEPLRVYHGTVEDVEAFKAELRGAATAAASAMRGFFFTPDPAVASGYASAYTGRAVRAIQRALKASQDRLAQSGSDGDRAAAEAAQQRLDDANAADRSSRVADGANVMPMHLRITNPLVVDFTGKQYDEGAYGRALDQAERNGNDGVIFRNAIDDPVNHEKVADIYVAFNPNQIKSAIGNNGNFDPNDDRIAFNRGPAAAPTWVSPDPSRLDDFIYALQDKNVDLRRAMQEMRKAGASIADAQDAYTVEELSTSRKAAQIKAFVETDVAAVLKQMNLEGLTIEEVEEYLHARHAPEANAQIASINPTDPNMQDGGSGMLTQDALDYMANLPAAKARALGRVARMIDGLNDGTRQLLVDSGLEKQETIDEWEATYSHYVPLQREGFEDQASRGGGQGVSVRGSAVKSRMGSKRAVVDIFANIVMQRERVITRAENNRVAQSLLGLAITNPNPDFWLPVNPDVKGSPARSRKLKRELIAMGLTPQDAAGVAREPLQRFYNQQTGLVETKLNPALRNRDNVIAVRVNGKDRFIFFKESDPRAMRMAAALKNLDARDMGRFMRMMSSITRYFAAVNTQFNVIFGQVNFLRDVQAALLNLGSTTIAGKGTEVAKEAARLYRATRGGLGTMSKLTGADAALWERFKAAGGTTGFRDIFPSSTARTTAIKRELDPAWWTKTSWGKVLTANGALKVPEETARQWVSHAFRWISDYNEALENITRLAAFKIALDEGATEQQAASLAKNLTTNFNRRGAWSQQLGAWYAFFNAGVQGTARIVQAVTTLENGQIRLTTFGKRVIAGGIGLGVIQALALAAAGATDDDPPEFVRERNLLLPDFVFGTGTYFSVPMPLGWHVLPNIGRKLTELALRGGARPAEAVFDLMRISLDAFNPLGSGTMSQTLTPTIGDPIVALESNKDWTGSKIAREDFNTLDPTPGFTRGKDDASVVGEAVARMLNAATGGTDFTPGGASPTPDQVDYLAGQIGGGVAREVIKGIDSVGTLMSGELPPPYRVPLAGRFVGTMKGETNDRNRFYENLLKINVAENEARGRKARGDDISGYLKKHPEALLKPTADKIKRDVDRLNKERRARLADGASAAEVRKLREDALTLQRMLNQQMATQEAR